MTTTLRQRMHLFGFVEDLSVRRSSQPHLVEHAFVLKALNGSDADAAQDLRDSFSRRVEPSQVMSKERLARWFAAA